MKKNSPKSVTVEGKLPNFYKPTKFEKEDFPDMDDLPTDTEEWNPEILQPVSCPYQFDNPDVYEKLTKPIQKAKFTCQVDIEVYFGVEKGREHKHGMVLDVDESKILPDSDLSEWLFDMGLHACSFDYDITHKTTATLVDREISEDKEAEEFREQIEKEAQKTIDETESRKNEQRFKFYKNKFANITDYLEKNLAEEMTRVVTRLLYEESAFNTKNDIRERKITLILWEEDKELRKRLQTPKGRTPIKLQQDFTKEKQKFINQCLKAFEKLAKKQRKLNKTELAETLFPRHSNPPQSLRRKFKALELSFDEVLEQFTEQKSS